MCKMTPEWRMLCVLWVLASAGVAGITIAMAHKPQTTTIQKIEPIQKIDRLLKTDKLKPSTTNPQPKPEVPVQIQGRKFWYA